MSTIRVRGKQLGSREAYQIIARKYAQGAEIGPNTAVTIASWWQSPRAIGHVLAVFAGGQTVDRSELLDDIARTRSVEGYTDGRMALRDKVAIDMLATFVINYERGNAR